MNSRSAIIVAAALATLSGPASAQSVSFGAELGGSARVFPRGPLFPGQASSLVSPSIVFAPEIMWSSESGAWAILGEGFFRLDAHDGNRSHADVRELGVEYLGGRLRAFAGVGQAFWGVTEVRHLVDVVNQVDAVEDLDGDDKLGQPMVAVTVDGSWGSLDLYYLPYFRERTFPSGDARLSGPVSIGSDAVYPSGAERWHPGFAARAFQTFGAIDLGVSAFRGMSREPRFVFAGDDPTTPSMQSVYDVIDQIGIDAQWTGESTLLKLETITRGGHGDRIYAMTGGIEHTLFQLLGSDGDLGLLSELMFDSRDPSAPPTIFENDVFVGGRWARNDVADTSVLGGPMIDLESGEVLVLLEAERRIGSVWRMSADARLFGNTDPGSLVHGLRNDSFVSLSLTRFF